MNRTDLNHAAKELFASALRAVDAREAMHRAVKLDKRVLQIRDTQFDLSGREVYSVAIGKAGAAMAAGLSDVLGDRLKGGILCAPSTADLALERWRLFSGGHPLPTGDSLAAAEATIALLRRLEDKSLVIFLISGGGSSMFELPVDDQITIDDLREANRQLVGCGASIAEVNALRRTFSAVKGGKLSHSALQADQVTLIVSDTNAGDEASVASGPTLDPAADAPEAIEVVTRYRLGSSLPRSILRAIEYKEDTHYVSTDRTRVHYVLLDNHTALEAASTKAKEFGFAVEVASDINEQEIDIGCDLLLSRARSLRDRIGGKDKHVCLISGGEFSCPVRGEGLGGRNSETVLRMAIKTSRANEPRPTQWVVLSGGTDGLDGNSPAAGAIADETTIARGTTAGLDVAAFLERSDSFSYFNSLGDAITTGPTGTNVRDFRVWLSDAG